MKKKNQEEEGGLNHGINSSLSLSLHPLSLLTTTTHPRIWVGWVISAASKGPDRGQNTSITPLNQYITLPPSFSSIFTPKSLKKHLFLAMLQGKSRFAWGLVTGWVPHYPPRSRI